jgi:hypothetical protein
VSSSIVAALGRERDCSDVFARAMECGKSLAQPLQRGKKTWESEQEIWKPVERMLPRQGDNIKGKRMARIPNRLWRTVCDRVA